MGRCRHVSCNFVSARLKDCFLSLWCEGGGSLWEPKKCGITGQKLQERWHWSGGSSSLWRCNEAPGMLVMKCGYSLNCYNTARVHTPNKEHWYSTFLFEQVDGAKLFSLALLWSISCVVWFFFVFFCGITWVLSSFDRLRWTTWGRLWMPGSKPSAVALL